MAAQGRQHFEICYLERKYQYFNNKRNHPNLSLVPWVLNDDKLILVQGIALQVATQIERFMRPIWGPPGADRTQVDPICWPHEPCYQGSVCLNLWCGRHWFDATMHQWSMMVNNDKFAGAGLICRYSASKFKHIFFEKNFKSRMIWNI